MSRKPVEMKEDELLREIRNSVIAYDEKTTIELVGRTLELGMNPKRVLEEGAIAGIGEVGELFAEGKIFIPEVMLSAEVFNTVMNMVKPTILKRGEDVKKRGTVVIGTVAGDVHDLGKNLVATLLTASGFEVFDLGRDVSAEVFVTAVKEVEPDVLALSALMSTTMLEQRDVIERLAKLRLRERVKVLVGGAPVTDEWAAQIGADGYAPNAHEAIELVKRILKEK